MLRCEHQTIALYLETKPLSYWNVYLVLSWFFNDPVSEQHWSGVPMNYARYRNTRFQVIENNSTDIRDLNAKCHFLRNRLYGLDGFNLYSVLINQQ
jgi:hypothetical protein